MTDHDDAFAAWLDRRFRSMTTVHRAVPPVLVVDDRRPAFFGARKASAAFAALVLGLGAGSALLAHPTGTNLPGVACASAAAHSDTVAAACATPTPSATASATATPVVLTTGSPSADADAHGDAVSAAAHNCPKGAGGVHGKCVSAVANGTSTATPSPSASPSAATSAPGKSGSHNTGH